MSHHGPWATALAIAMTLQTVALLCSFAGLPWFRLTTHDRAIDVSIEKLARCSEGDSVHQCELLGEASAPVACIVSVALFCAVIVLVLLTVPYLVLFGSSTTAAEDVRLTVIIFLTIAHCVSYIALLTWLLSCARELNIGGGAHVQPTLICTAVTKLAGTVIICSWLVSRILDRRQRVPQPRAGQLRRAGHGHLLRDAQKPPYGSLDAIECSPLPSIDLGLTAIEH